MTHIHPGTDTTVNPGVVDDSFRSKKTIRSVIRPKVYAVIEICGKAMGVILAGTLIFFIIVAYSPVWIPIVVKAWFDEDSIKDAFLEVFKL